MDLVNRDDCEAFVTKDTSQIREIMAYRNSACERMSLAEATLPPGGHTHCHHHPKTEEIYYVLSGSGRVQSGAEERDIGPGDAILHPPGVPHEAWNTGTTPLVFLCVCSPAYEHEDTVIHS